MARAYNHRVRPKAIQVGDLVIRRAEITCQLGKLDAKWEGPYKIVEVVNVGAHRLQHLDGKDVPRTWNIANLKKYYQ